VSLSKIELLSSGDWKLILNVNPMEHVPLERWLEVLIFNHQS